MYRHTTERRYIAHAGSLMNVFRCCLLVLDTDLLPFPSVCISVPFIAFAAFLCSLDASMLGLER